MSPDAPPIVERKGAGTSLWDVGFRADGRAVRFARSGPPAPGRAPRYEGFDLRGRRPYPVEDGGPAYRHAVAAEAGWAIRPASPFRLDFLDPRGRGWRGELDEEREQRWWSYTVIPPDPAAGHADPVAAVGSGTGVALWNLATGRPTRFFAGHAGPVYAPASSPDGRWLATTSSDQTVRLWPLAGCDRPARFGARFERDPAGAWIVAEVTPGGFAEGIGLARGHVIEGFYIGPDRKDPGEFLPGLDDRTASPIDSFQARMGRAGELIRAGTSKRDHPALTLFPGEDREWVLWTPRGHYDTSVAGDRRHLGWLTNRGTVARLLAGTFDTIDKFEARYRQPKAPAANAIDRLLDTADPALALAALPAVDPAAADPTTSRLDEIAVRPSGPAPAGAGAGGAAIAYRAVAAEGAALIRRAAIAVNGREVAQVSLAAPAGTVAGDLAIPVGSGVRQVVSLIVEDAQGTRRTRSFEVDNRAPPPPARRKARLEVLAIGAETFSDPRFGRIAFAERDAEDLARFFCDRLVDPTSAPAARFEPDRVRVRALVNSQLTAASVASALDELGKSGRDGSLAADDVVVVVIESHYLEVGSQRLLATAEADDGHPAPPSVHAGELGDRLGELAGLGCRVFVFVDAVHPIKQEGWDHEIKEWVRQLQARSKVAAFLASEHEPSLGGLDGHRVFAQAMLDVSRARADGRAGKATGPVSLFDFQRTVIDGALELSDRRQRAQFYLPETLSIRAPFLDRPRPGILGPRSGPDASVEGARR